MSNEVVENGGANGVAAFNAEIATIFNIPEDSKELFAPLVCGLAEALLSGPNFPPGVRLTPYVDELVEVAFPNFRTVPNLSNLFLDYLKDNSMSLSGKLQDLHGQGSFTWVIAQRHLIDILKHKEVFRADKLMKTWQLCLAKFDYSPDQLNTIAGLANSGTREFLAAIQLLAIYRVTLLRPDPLVDEVEGEPQGPPGGPAQLNQVGAPNAQGVNNVSSNVTAPVAPVAGSGQGPLDVTAIANAVMGLITPQLSQILDRVNVLEGGSTGGTSGGALPVIPPRRNVGTIDLSGVQQQGGGSQQAAGSNSSNRMNLEQLAHGVSSMFGGRTQAGESLSNNASSNSGSGGGLGSGGGDNVDVNSNNKSKAAFTASTGLMTAEGQFLGRVTGDWWLLPLSQMMSDLSSLRNSYGVTKHRTLESLRDEMYASPGLRTVDISGIPLVYHVPAYQKHLLVEPKLKSVRYNPDNNYDLSRLGDLQFARYIHPTTHWHFDAFIEHTRRAASRETCVGYVQKTGSELADYVMDYRDAFYNFAEGRLGRKEDWHHHPHHITNWAILVCLHLNVWMRAVLAADLSLLVKDFRIIADGYSVLLQENYDGSPKVLLRMALEFLHYLCPICFRPGSCNAYCVSPSCKVDLTAVQGGAKFEKPVGYQVAFKAWKKDQKKDLFAESAHSKWTKKFHEDKPEWAPVKVVSAEVAGGGYDGLAKSQQLIVIHKFEGNRMY
jgi:hypothetical protein